MSSDLAFPTSALTVTSQHAQLRPHEGFRQTTIRPRNDGEVFVTGEGPNVPFAATPPDWTKQAACLGRWELFDQPNARTYELTVKPICDGCPVKDLCLREAMKDEVLETGDPAPASHRAGIRGGLRPIDRARMVVSAPPLTCVHGHEMKEGVALMRTDSQGWKCGTCHAERKRAARKDVAA